MAVNIATNFRNGGIRQGNVYIIEDFDSNAPVALGLGRVRDPQVQLEAVASEEDSQGRTSVIAYRLNAQAVLMQHTNEEIEAVGKLAYPDAATPQVSEGFDILFTNGPLKKDDVEAELADGNIPGILIRGVFPKVTLNINFGPEDSAIELMFDGVVRPDSLVSFKTLPIIQLG